MINFLTLSPLQSSFRQSTLFKYTSIFICATSLLTACSEPEAPTAPPKSVKIVTVTAQDAPVTYEFVGRTASSQQVQVRSRVEGFLEDRLYTEGSMVKEGDILFQIDAKPFQTQLAAAKAALNEQRAKLKVNLANLKRVKPLAEADAVSQKELDDAQGRVNGAAASVEMAKADVDIARLDLSYTTIYAPVSGASSFARVQNGAFVDATNSLLTYVAQLDPIWVDFNLSENEILKFRSMKEKGLIITPENNAYEVELILADGTSFTETGKIFFSDANYSEETGTFLLRATFKNPERLLRPGQFVKVLLKGTIQPNSILLPQKSISQGAKGFFAWVVDDQNKAQLRNIEVGNWQGDDWFVLDGIDDGDRVITSGFLALSPGQSVVEKSADSNPSVNK